MLAGVAWSTTPAPNAATPPEFPSREPEWQADGQHKCRDGRPRREERSVLECLASGPRARSAPHVECLPVPDTRQPLNGPAAARHDHGSGLRDGEQFAVGAGQQDGITGRIYSDKQPSGVQYNPQSVSDRLHTVHPEPGIAGFGAEPSPEHDDAHPRRRKRPVRRGDCGQGLGDPCGGDGCAVGEVGPERCGQEDAPEALGRQRSHPYIVASPQLWALC